jgi:hypothetical protein
LHVDDVLHVYDGSNKFAGANASISSNTIVIFKHMCIYCNSDNCEIYKSMN